MVAVAGRSDDALDHAGRSSAGHGRRTSATRPSKQITPTQSAHGARYPAGCRDQQPVTLRLTTVHACRCIYWFVLALFTLAERVSDMIVFWSVPILQCIATSLGWTAYTRNDRITHPLLAQDPAVL